MRERLIDAAIGQFTKRGIAGSSLRAIAADADATPAMLHYYFGVKESMIQAVVEERLLPALAPMRAFAENAGDEPAETVERFVRCMADVVAQNPWLPPLWVREVLCEGGALREVLFTRAIPHAPKTLARRFVLAQAAGKLDAALNPRLLVVSLVGLTLFPAAGAPIWRRLLDGDDVDGHAMLEHTLALLRHGVGPAAPIRKRTRT